MAISFQGIDVTEWIGQVNGLPMLLCGGNSRQVKMNIDWRLYEPEDGQSLGIQLNLDGIQPAFQLDAIRSVYVDNVGSPTPVYVYFPDSQFVAIYPPYSYGWSPVITNASNAIVYAVGLSTDNLPLTNIWFTNAFVPLAINTLSAAISETPVEISYLGSAVVNLGNAASNTFTFNAFGIGVAASDRRIIVGASLGRDGDPAVITGITFDVSGTDDPMTIINQNTNKYDIGSNEVALTEGLAVIDAPTGTTAQIIVTCSQRKVCRIFVWSVTGVSSAVPFFEASSKTGNPSGNANRSLQNLLDLQAGAALCGFGGSTKIGNNINEPVLTGATLDESFQDLFGSGNAFRMRCNAFSRNNNLVANPSYPTNMDWTSTGNCILQSLTYSNQ